MGYKTHIHVEAELKGRTKRVVDVSRNKDLWNSIHIVRAHHIKSHKLVINVNFEMFRNCIECENICVPVIAIIFLAIID